jgi:chromosome segregation ATPase
VQEQEQTKVGHSKSFADDNAGSGAAKLKYEYEGTFAVLPSSESPKKATMIGEEYEALLQSALEDQAQHYESEISRLRAALAADQINLTKLNPLEMQHIESLNSDIARLRTEVDHVGRQLLDAQAQEAGYKAASKRLLREQGVAKELLQRIQEESSKEYDAGKSQVEELKQQLADLTGNLRMIHQFSQNEELNNAQIFGTTSSEDRPNAAKKTGKKNRRSFRK